MDLRKVKPYSEDLYAINKYKNASQLEDTIAEEDFYNEQEMYEASEEILEDKIRSNNEIMMKERQELAYKYMTEGRNVFLTGDAGTGKSYVVSKFIEWCNKNEKNVLITAPTGIAALNIDGSTLHRVFRAPIGPLVQPIKSVSSLLKDADVVIIDEISMCRIDLFEYVIKQIMSLNIMRRKKNILKDIQIVLSGDFFQLPPVIIDSEREVLNRYFGRDIGYGYAFQSELWDGCNFISIVLDEVVRQRDEAFMLSLNKARLGDKSCISYFQNYSSRNEIKDAILLCGTNKKAKEKNTYELGLITSKSKIFQSKITGEVKDSDKVTEDSLELKVGARVMTLVNDKEDNYKNGSFGTIKAFNSSENTITVLMDSGVTVDIEKYTWEIKGYDVDEHNKLKQKTIGTFTQFPLKLAYAITIHKSQGQTYDKVNVNPYCWDYGQLYVALSRCTNIETMHLTQYIKPDFLKASPEVIKFYKSLLNK